VHAAGGSIVVALGPLVIRDEDDEREEHAYAHTLLVALDRAKGTTLWTRRIREYPIEVEPGPKWCYVLTMSARLMGCCVDDQVLQASKRRWGLNEAQSEDELNAQNLVRLMLDRSDQCPRGCRT
jgi:hypothetical protein